MQALELPDAYLRELRELLDSFAPQAEVWAFGSRSEGRSHEGSDLDLILRNPAQLDQPQTGLSALRGALESNLPILVDVLDWARLPDEFHREIERSHVILRHPLASIH